MRTSMHALSMVLATMVAARRPAAELVLDWFPSMLRGLALRRESGQFPLNATWGSSTWAPPRRRGLSPVSPRSWRRHSRPVSPPRAALWAVVLPGASLSGICRALLGRESSDLGRDHVREGRQPGLYGRREPLPE